MREIKFRAWWKTQSVMAPVYDLKYDFYNPQENMPSTKTLILKTLSIDTHSTYPYKDFLNHGKIGWNNPNMMVNVEECVLMQYTGLKDRNGVEIYEGDIVVNVDNKGNRECEFYKKKEKIFPVELTIDGWKWGYHFYISEAFNYFKYKPLIIGNIYENPELLITKD